ncbi:ATP-binding protein [Parabacteroides sp. 52]|uniref:ATP-binding protein n=1 Tax=unclassified Parabacteroides TaxID=2649774 RepID=UPI0013D4AD99|nr:MULTISPECIES: ATP-binding protein [unclassified Parabacteroides]NDV54435.1 ATP-binding protein [Parabacteroides sp. 52]
MRKEIHIINEIDQLVHVSEALKEVLSPFDWPQKICMNLNLALEEAVTNVILYAYPQEKNKDITICLEASEHKLKIVLMDYGVEFDPTARPEPDTSLPLHERSIGGLGIYLVKEMMTDVKYSRQGNKNVLTMTKEIR